MTDKIREFIISRIRERKLTDMEVSRLLKKNPAYMNQFLKRGIPRYLNEDTRESLAGILDIDPRMLKNKKNEEKPSDIPRNGDVQTNAGQSKDGNRAHQFGPDTVSLLGHIKTSSGTITMGNEIGKALRHPNQQGRSDGYAVEVWDNTMAPRYLIGEVAYPLKEKHPAQGQDCYIFFTDGEVLLRKFIEKTNKEIIFEQLKPAKKAKRMLSDVKEIHAIVGRG